MRLVSALLLWFSGHVPRNEEIVQCPKEASWFYERPDRESSWGPWSTRQEPLQKGQGWWSLFGTTEYYWLYNFQQEEVGWWIRCLVDSILRHYKRQKRNVHITRPSKQFEFCNYLLDKSLISQGYQSGFIGQCRPGGPVVPSSGQGGPGGQGGQGGRGDPVGQGGQGDLQGLSSPCSPAGQVSRVVKVVQVVQMAQVVRVVQVVHEDQMVRWSRLSISTGWSGWSGWSRLSRWSRWSALMICIKKINGSYSLNHQIIEKSWDVTPVTNWHTDWLTWESRAAFWTNQGWDGIFSL